jgi:hypothetical protein
MANTTFSGPVISKNGFITTGPGITKTINSTGLGAAGLPLTVNAHAGRILISQDADGIYKLPTLVLMLMEQQQVILIIIT